MKGTCPMAKIGQHFVGMLWTQKEHISGARRYVQHARPGGHIEERPLGYAASVDVAPKIETRVGDTEAACRQVGSGTPPPRCIPPKPAGRPPTLRAAGPRSIPRSPAPA